MGTTAKHGLYYPEGNDLVMNGDDAMQALAETVEAAFTARWAPAVAQINPAVNGGALTATAVVVGFPGSVQYMEQFDFNGGTLTYLGAPRLFHVAAFVTIGATALSNQFVIYSGIELVQSQVTIDVASTRIESTTNNLDDLTHVHRVGLPTQLVAGDTLQVKAYASPNAVANLVGLRVYPIGPVNP